MIKSTTTQQEKQSLRTFGAALDDLLSDTAEPRLLLAISGGMDSVILGHLVHGLSKMGGRKSLNKSGVAHLNHQLRAAASDEDACFVGALATEWGFAFHLHKERPKNHHGEGLQASARALRYAWLEQLRITENYTHIATAHHLDDSLEGLLLQLLRGTGLAALRGCAPQRGPLIRPLHAWSKAQLYALAKQHEWRWREDESNKETRFYRRNWIRHHITTPLQTLMPEGLGPFRRSLARLRNAQAIVEAATTSFAHIHLQRTPYGEHLQLPQNWPAEDAKGLVYELLQRYGLSYTRYEQLCACLKRKHHSGKRFDTNSHHIYTDRQSLYLVPHESIQTTRPKAQTFDWPPKNQQQTIHYGHHQLHIERQPKSTLSHYKSDKCSAYLDEAQLQAPLELRPPKAGDRFYPYGQKGKQKVSDFLINKKIPLPLKKHVLLLCSAGQIAWIAGLAIDTRFCIRPTTHHIIHLRLCTSVL